MESASTRVTATIGYCDSAGGEVRLAAPDHEWDEVSDLHAAHAVEGVVGVEAGGDSTRFVELVEGLGHRVLIGDEAARGTAKRDERLKRCCLRLLRRRGAAKAKGAVAGKPRLRQV